MSTRTRRLGALAAGLAAALTLTACGSTGGSMTAPPSAEQPTLTYVAAPATSDDILVLTVRSDTLSAYLCDGFGTGEFFEGPVTAGGVSLESPGGARLVARLTGDLIEGEYRFRLGNPITFTAVPQVEAGTFLVRVLEDGTIRGDGSGGGELRAELGDEGVTGGGTYPSGRAFSLDSSRTTEHAPHIDDFVRDGAALSGSKVVVFEEGPAADPGGATGARVPLPGGGRSIAAEVAGEFRFNVVRGMVVGKRIKDGTSVYVCINDHGEI